MVNASNSGPLRPVAANVSGMDSHAQTDEAAVTEPSIEVTEDGPLRVQGPVRIVRRREVRDAEGAAVAWQDVMELRSMVRHGCADADGQATSPSATPATGKVSRPRTRLRPRTPNARRNWAE